MGDRINAEEDYAGFPARPKDPNLKSSGAIAANWTAADPEGDRPKMTRFGKVGKQTIKDTGPLNRKRMETMDDETSDRAIDFMKRQKDTSKPFFCWFNATRMHLFTHVRESHRGKFKHGDSEYIDGMIEHDETIGKILKALDDMGVADNTIVVYTSDNGPHMNTWPDGAMTHFRSEKNTNWEARSACRAWSAGRAGSRRGQSPIS